MAKTDEELRKEKAEKLAKEARDKELARRAAVKKAQKESEAGLYRPMVR